MSPNSLAGRSRAVPVLGVTQLLAWGTIYYTPVLTVPLIAAERGWSITFTMGGFSMGLFVGGLVAPTVGRMIDRYGGHRVMALGSLAGALGLFGLVYADRPLAFLAVWALLGLAMAASLYDPAFATLGRIFGIAARRPITLLTFVGGFASTLSWPATHFLLEAYGWRGTYLVYAALLALIAAPLHAFALPRERAYSPPPSADEVERRPALLPATGISFLLVAAAFAAYAFVPSALSAHMLAIFDRLGMDRGTAVLIGALFGPAQVLARLTEFLFAREVHPLAIARFAVALLIVAFLLLALFGLPVFVAALFAVLYGASNGLMTIARGTVPLALFGPSGYGALIGRIAGPSLVIQSAAPLVIAFVAERVSDPAGLAVIGAFGAVSLLAFLAIRRPA
jgi:hypothetical protein